MRVILQNNNRDCLLACYAMILDYFGAKVPVYKLYENKAIPADGLGIRYLEKLNKKYNLIMKVYKVEKIQLETLFYKIKYPFIIYVNSSHYMVVEEIKNKIWTVIDPAVGRMKYAYDEISKKYSGYIIFFEKGKNFKRIKEKTQFKKMFINTLKNIYTINFVFSIIISQFCMILFAGLIRNIISEKYGWIISLFVLSVIILIQILSLRLKVGSLEKYNEQFENIITKKIFEDVLNQNLDFFRNYTPGGLSEKLNLKNSVRDSLVLKIVPSIISFTTIIVAFIYLFIVSIDLSLLVLFLSFLYFMVSIFFYKKQIELNAVYIQKNIDLSSLIQTTLENIDWIKALRQEKRTEKEWIRLSRVNLEEYNKIIKIESTNQILGIIFKFLTLTVILISALKFNKIFNISFTDIILYQTLITVFISSLESIKYAIFEYSKLRIIIYKQLDLIYNNNIKKIIKLNDSNLIIKLENVSFSYDNKNYLLRDLNIEILKGEKIALVGKSGCGKSTLIRTLLGLTDYEGKIFYSFDDTEENLGVVLQEMSLRQGTILENLCGEKDVENIDLENIYSILKETNLYGIINKLPKKLLSNVYRLGQNLSGGQIQKILITRSLIGDKKVIFWDEAFSSIDNDSRKHIYKSILKNSKYNKITMIISSHHLDVLDYSDRVIFFDNGNLLIGSHENLIKNSNSYRDFINSSK